MLIKIDYYIKENGTTMCIMHTELSDKDIEDIVVAKFRAGDIACPINYDRESCEISVNIDEVRI